MNDCLLKAGSSASTRPRGEQGAATAVSRARQLGLLLFLLAVLGAGGCGQKGDLYLPDEAPEDTASR